MAKTKENQQTEPKLLDLKPGQFMVFPNDKGENVNRPDYRGQWNIPGQPRAFLSLWRGRTVLNKVKLDGQIQVREGDSYRAVGKVRMHVPNGWQPGQNPVMIAEASLEDSPNFAGAMNRFQSENGLVFYAGYFNEVAKEFIDPMADEPITDERSDDDEYGEIA